MLHAGDKAGTYREMEGKCKVVVTIGDVSQLKIRYYKLVTSCKMTLWQKSIPTTERAKFAVKTVYICIPKINALSFLKLPWAFKEV